MCFAFPLILLLLSFSGGGVEKKKTKLKKMGMRLRVFTSDVSGACVNTFAAQVVQCVERARLETDAIRVGVTIRGDGRMLAEKLRDRLPNLAIDTVSSSSMSARLDATVRVWVGRKERFVLGLCNVAKVTPLWTLKEYSEWVEPILLRLLGYYQDERDWAHVYDIPGLKGIVDAVHALLEVLYGVRSRIAARPASEQVEDLLLFKRAVDAGIDAAEVAAERAGKAILVAPLWTLKEYSEWVTDHKNDPDLTAPAGTVEPILLRLLGYYQDDRVWADVYGRDGLYKISSAADQDYQELRAVKSHIDARPASEQVEDLLLFKRAVDAGMDAAQVAKERADKAFGLLHES